MAKKVLTDLNATGRTITATTFSGALSGTATLANDLTGGNSTTLLGSIPYQSNTDTTTLLSPNTTATKKFLRQTGTGTNGAAPAWDTVTSTDVGLGSVENTALSTWAGSTNITTVGTIGAGTWQGTAIGNSYITTALSGKTYEGITFSGTAATTMTFPTTNATIARTDAAQTFTGTQTFSGQITANGNIATSAGTAITIFSGNASSTTASSNVIIRSGNQTGTAVSGNTTLLTGTTAGATSGTTTVSTGAATGGASGAVSILTGTTTTSGNSGSVYLNVGTAAGTAGGIGIGNATLSNTVAPSVINIGTTGVTTNLNGSVTTPFNTTTTTSGAGILSGSHYYFLTSTRALVTTAGSQSVFGVSLPLEANTLYEFEVSFGLTAVTSVSGSNSTVYLSVALPTSATFSDESIIGTGTTSTSPSRQIDINNSTPATTTTLTYSGTSSTVNGMYRMRGTIRTAGSTGNFTPNIVLANSSNALSSLTLSTGAWTKVTKVGAANANISYGGWA